ncbi:FAD-binding oxidoreductase [Paenibacillus turicensis]|uniref:NAD(P)/FAD-dependent oxidoreductase n=1 Tax=Paenibacillus turicensis TaxID=160487 RepID=UPI003D2AF3A1
MKLHYGQYYWTTTLNQKIDYPQLQEDISCDVLVIGGGMGGVTCSYQLSKQGFDTVLIEENEIASGSTQTNTGLLQFCSDKMLTSFIHTIGEELAVHFYQLSLDAVKQLTEISSALSEDARVLPRNSLYLASTPEDVRLLQEEYNNLQRFKFPVEWWDKQKLQSHFPFQNEAALYTGGDAKANPYVFVKELSQLSAKHGARIFEKSKLNSLKCENDHVLVYVGKHRIQSKKVIFATGYTTQEFKPDRGADLVASYVIVTDIVPELHSHWFEDCLIWETARPYFYIRTSEDGRIIAGGLDEPLPPNGLEEGRYLHKSEQLLGTVHEMFPMFTEAKSEYSWGAVFGGTRDGLPFIGPHYKYPNCYFLQGYGGNGTVCSMIGANLLTDLISGKDRPDAAMFDLMRGSKK